jgi:hypothetical protein
MRYDNSLLFRFITNFVGTGCVQLAFLPSIFVNLYAEDGVALLQDALTMSTLAPYLIEIGGFFPLVHRIGGTILSLFPLNYSAQIAALFTLLCIAFLASVIYQHSKTFLQRFDSRFVLVMFFLLNPIANFNAVGSICNLYFYLMAAAAVLIVPKELTRKELISNSLVMLLAGLTNPLCLFLLPILFLFKVYEYRKKKIIAFGIPEVCLIVSIFVHFFMIWAIASRDRSPLLINSWKEVIYLTLDRVVGISVIPFWGFVSGDENNPKFENTIYPESLFFRGTIAITFIVLLIVAKFHNRISWDKSWFFCVVFLFQSVLFSIFIGLTYNLEPRYAIFSTFTFIAFLIGFSERSTRVLHKSILFLLLVVLLSSLRLSSTLIDAPNWREEVKQAKRDCNMSNSTTVKLQVSPTSARLYVTMPCKVLRYE